ncbi:hypothetical protein DJ010_20580 [Nocardioides silvaticus]|uniref:M23ase beta-sheet core domain-containing protein n=1 Tax=Nocardioides silvaticus TaxID=2201891 RepID=A0A316TCK2_9ACTN|nr:M23 family metallopeptidase [Nocardioides silvaticus]PWN01015.1 hypothetical protein DJ010_20580 [Nocardioides silvaticus]
MPAALLVVMVVGCVAEETDETSGGSTPSVRATPTTSDAPPATVATTVTPPPAPSPEPPPQHREKDPDPRWEFYVDDRRWYRSPWFAGAHRLMIGFGCNTAPWYSPDPRCPGDQGFHHGIDVAMSCGTTLRAGTAGEVLPLDAPGSPGTAYGDDPVRLRIAGGYDVLLGHTSEVFVQPGERVEPGQRIALASDSGAPDGCHLHFEVRPAGGSVSTAVDPAEWLLLEADLRG